LHLRSIACDNPGMLRRSASVAGLALALACSSSDEPTANPSNNPSTNPDGTPEPPPGEPEATEPVIEGTPAMNRPPEGIGGGDIPLAGEPVVGDPVTGTPDDTASVPQQVTLAPLPTVRQEHAVVALGDEIFVIGGFTPAASSSVAAYDPGSDSWRAVAPFPEVLHHANAGVIGGKLYVAGFYVGASFTNASGAVYEYDPALDGWTGKTAMPAGTERASACVATLADKLYLLGGARNGSVADASVYDPANDAWEELPALPEPREHCAAGAIDGTIIIAGGRAAGIGGFQPNTWVYDPVARSYELRAPLLTARGGVAGAVLEGKLYIFGGEGNAADASGVFPQVEAYDPATDTWEALPNMLAPRHGLAAATSGASIYLPGGASQQGFGAVDTNTAFFLN
jgi:N-acetylneuraminic acid mutarotase